jgi:hypothetical protein
MVTMAEKERKGGLLIGTAVTTGGARLTVGENDGSEESHRRHNGIGEDGGGWRPRQRAVLDRWLQ